VLKLSNVCSKYPQLQPHNVSYSPYLRDQESNSCIVAVARTNSVMFVPGDGRSVTALCSTKGSSWRIRDRQLSLLLLPKFANMKIGSGAVPEALVTAVETSSTGFSSDVQDVWSTIAKRALPAVDSHMLKRAARFPYSLFISMVFLSMLQFFPRSSSFNLLLLAATYCLKKAVSVRWYQRQILCG
jgi:hypothetical protein